MVMELLIVKKISFKKTSEQFQQFVSLTPNNINFICVSRIATRLDIRAYFEAYVKTVMKWVWGGVINYKSHKKSLNMLY